jgi:hypothetical protein
LGEKNGLLLPGPAKCLRWPLAALLIRPPAFFFQLSPSTYGHSRIFFDFHFYFGGGQNFYSQVIRLYKILCWAENLPGEMAVRTPHQ